MRITVTVRGLDEAIEYLDMVENRLQNDRHRGLYRSVNRIADVWLDSYEQGGSRVGGWPDLAEYTVERREALGYNGTNPILERSGALKGVMVEHFTRAKSKSSVSRSDPYSAHTTRSSIAVNDGIATIDAHGWKVSNQFKTSGRYGHPARPIWFVDKNVRFAARGGLVDWLVNDVLRP